MTENIANNDTYLYFYVGLKAILKHFGEQYFGIRW